MSEASNEAPVSEPAWVQELKPLPLPYAHRTQLRGEDAALFTKCVTGAYDKGGSILDIAGHTNRSFGTVRRSLIDAEVKLRKRGERPRTGPTVA